MLSEATSAGISDAEFDAERHAVDPPLRTKEELAYFRIFREHLRGVRAEIASSTSTNTGGGAARVVSWEDWRRIDAAERQRGLLLGKEREKFTRTADMIAAARGLN